MSKLFNSINKGFSRIFRILLFIFSAFLIIYFFPKSGKFKYSFENGRPWQSENLYAPFDFAIKKTNEEISDEINIAKINTPLFFEVDTTFINKSSDLLDERLNELNNDSLFNVYSDSELVNIKTNSLKIINEVYSIGLIEENYDFKESQQVSLLLNNKVVNSTSYDKLIKPENLITFINNRIIELNIELYENIQLLKNTMKEFEITRNSGLLKDCIEQYQDIYEKTELLRNNKYAEIFMEHEDDDPTKPMYLKTRINSIQDYELELREPEVVEFNV